MALAGDHKLYLVESRGVRESPYRFACEAIDAARRHGGRIVVERNHGGQWLVEVFERAMSDKGIRLPLATVHASQGKVTRAEPVAALYEQGHVRHVGRHDELEDQLMSFDGTGASPDRLDALVWAASQFTGDSFSARPYSGPTVVRWSDARPKHGEGVARWAGQDLLDEDPSAALDAWVRGY